MAKQKPTPATDASARRTLLPYGRQWVDEDDIAAVARAAGVSQVVHGSDYPHPEGLRESVLMLQELDAFSPAEQQRIMRGNGVDLLGLASR